MNSSTVGHLVDSLIPFAGGLYGTLLGYRVIGKSGDPKWEAWHRRFGRHLKWLGPVLMALSFLMFLFRTI